MAHQSTALLYPCNERIRLLLQNLNTLYQKKLFYFEIHCTIVQGLSPDFKATLKFCKKFNFDQNQLKLAMQHKNMYMYQIKL